MEEIWKDISGYEGIYQVSSLGRVRSIDRIGRQGRFLHGQILRGYVGRQGYRYVTLKDGNVIKWSQQPHIRAQRPELALLFHIPNGGTRDAVEGKHLKQQGVKPGVPDLCLPVPSGRYHGLFIEMKTDTGRASEAQKWWIERLTDAGYFAQVCHGWASAVSALEWYLSLEDTP